VILGLVEPDEQLEILRFGALELEPPAQTYKYKFRRDVPPSLWTTLMKKPAEPESHLHAQCSGTKRGKLLLFIFVEVFKDFTVNYIYYNVDHGYGFPFSDLLSHVHIYGNGELFLREKVF